MFGNGFPFPNVPTPQTTIYSSFTLCYSGQSTYKKMEKEDEAKANLKTD